MDSTPPPQTKIPAHVRQAFIRMLADVKDHFIVTLMKERPASFRGYRPTKANAGAARKKLEREIEAAKDLNGVWVLLLQRARTAADLVDSMDPRWVRRNAEVLGSAAEPGEFVAGLLLSEREEMRAIAWDYIDRWAEAVSDADARQSKLDKAYKLFTPFLDSSWQIYGAKIVWAPREKGGEEQSATAAALEDAERRLEVLRKKLERSQEDSRAALEEKDRKLRRCEEALDRLRRDLVRLKEENAGLAQSLDDAREGARTQAVALAEAALHERIRPWFEPVDRADKVVHSLTGDLCARATQVLAIQSEHDRQYGNRRVLAGRLAECERLIRELDDARATALLPVPALAPMAVELRAEVERLRKALGHVEPASGHVTTALGVINAAANMDELRDLSELVEQTRRLGVFRDLEVGIIFEALHRKRTELFDREAARRRAPVLTPVERFIRIIGVDTLSDATIYVDGHNVLFLLARYIGSCLDERGVPTPAGRGVLTERLSLAFEGLQQLSVRLYFDGREDSETVVRDRLRVIYAGGIGPHRADRAILRDLTYQPPDSTALIVTRDIALAREAGKKRAARVDPQELAPFVSDVQA